MQSYNIKYVHTSFPIDNSCPPNHWGPLCLCFEENTAYYGNNHIFGHENPKKSRIDCQQSCEFDSNCNFWTFRKPVQRGGQGFCYLKTKRENVTNNIAIYVSGTKNCQLPEWTGWFASY